QFGATDVINSREADPVAEIQALTGGNGADVVIEAVGRPETYRQAFYARDLAGTLVQVGVPTPDMRIELPLLDLFGRGGALKSSWYGDCLPERDFPMLTGLYLQGRLPLEKFVSAALAPLRHAYLIRDPAELLASYAKVRSEPTLEDLGIVQQAEIFDTYPGPVVDSRDLLENPEGMLRALCAALSIPFTTAMLSWPAGRRDFDGVWGPYWYDSVWRSTGFGPYRP